MKNTRFSLSFASTLALVLISTLVLSACAPQSDAPSNTTNGMESSAPAATGSTPSEMTPNTNSSETQTLTFSPRYITPGGEETIDIMLTLANGVVTEATALPQAKHPTSKQMQAGFEQDFSGAVVGKTLSELENIDRIGGASLTTGGFRRAVAELSQS